MNLKTFSILTILAITSAYSKDGKNVTASYNGNTGVYETPNARIQDDWSMRFFLNEDKPYRYYGITATPIDFLEANFHMTQVSGVDGFEDSAGYGDYKDKSLSFKILLKKESDFFPAVAIGADDIWGTALYSSKYVVASKNISYFDITAGYGKGRLGGEDLNKYNTGTSNSGSTGNNAVNFLKNTEWDGGKLFGSMVFNATSKLQLIGEYSPIDYKKDKINPFLTGDRYALPKSNFNYGLKYKYSDNSIFSMSYQRGTTLSFGYTYQFSFDRTGMFDHLPDFKWKADRKKKDEYKNLAEKDLSNKLANEVAAEKFKNVKVSVNENKIWAEIENSRYNNDLQAVGRAISTIDEVAPSYYDTIYMTLKNNEVQIKTFKVNRKEFDMFENEQVSNDYMKNALIISNDIDEKYNEFSNNEEVYKSKSFNKERFRFDLAPKVRTMLNHKDKPFAMKATIKAYFSFDLNDNITVNNSYEHPFFHTGKNLTNEPLEDEKLSLRSNITEHFVYNKTQMPYLSITYLDNAFSDSFVKAEAGYLEYAFAGIDLEWYKPFENEKFGIGLQYQNVYKRKIDDFFALTKKYNYDAKFLNIYYFAAPKYDIHLGAKIGQFLAGDKGIKIDISRHYKDFTFGAFATITDSDKVFDNEENKGYIDKGVYLKVPLEVFTYKNVKKRLNYGLSPWTRDVGQYADTLESLYPMNNSENNSQIMKKYINRLKD